MQISAGGTPTPMYVLTTPSAAFAGLFFLAGLERESKRASGRVLWRRCALQAGSAPYPLHMR